MQNKILPTITIGIPAYNEEQNIYELLSALLQQNLATVNLEKVIVVADGSTDGTVGQIQRITDKRVALMHWTRRRGLAAGQNYIVENTRSDVLVLLDADILPQDNNFIVNN